MTTTGQPTTHERYLHAVRDLVIARAREQNTITVDQALRVTHTKLLLAGIKAGHSIRWKDTAVALGFTVRPAAARQVYHLAMIDPTIRHAVHQLARRIGDGRPEFRTFAIPTLPTKPRPCSAGTGTRGGRSRGKASGSRMRLWECACTPKPVKVRVAADDFQATCDLCHTAFKRKQ